MTNANKLTIIQDTREKQPWKFRSYEKCAAQKVEYLTEGDYILEGYPDLICIERKKTVTELAGNLGTNYGRFKREIEKLKRYRFSYIICEFTQDQMLVYPTGAKLPKWLMRKIRMSGKFLQHRVNELVSEYGIEFIFCENRFKATDRAMDLLLEAKRVYDNDQKQ